MKTLTKAQIIELHASRATRRAALLPTLEKCLCAAESGQFWDVETDADDRDGLEIGRRPARRGLRVGREDRDPEEARETWSAEQITRDETSPPWVCVEQRVGSGESLFLAPKRVTRGREEIIGRALTEPMRFMGRSRPSIVSELDRHAPAELRRRLGLSDCASHDAASKAQRDHHDPNGLVIGCASTQKKGGTFRHATGRGVYEYSETERSVSAVLETICYHAGVAKDGIVAVLDDAPGAKMRRK